MTQVWIALGSNLGDRGRQLSLAVDHLSRTDLPALRLSHIYETAPEHGAAEPPYLNAVLQTESSRDPVELLTRLQSIEEALGRPRVGGGARPGPRLIDLDLLAMGDLVVGGTSPSARSVSRSGAAPGCAVAASENAGPPWGRAGEPPGPASLELPHPRLHLRSFVLVPLCEIDPHWRHPVTGRTAASLLAELEVAPGSVQLYGSLAQEISGGDPYPWRQLPARGAI